MFFDNRKQKTVLENSCLTRPKFLHRKANLYSKSDFTTHLTKKKKKNFYIQKEIPMVLTMELTTQSKEQSITFTIISIILKVETIIHPLDPWDE